MIARITHLVRRVATTLKGRTPSPPDLRWAAELLTPSEMTLFSSMEPIDQAHALEVARRTEVAVGQVVEVTDWVLVAALLHDIGKIESRNRRGRARARDADWPHGGGLHGGTSRPRTWSDRVDRSISEVPDSRCELARRDR